MLNLAKMYQTASCSAKVANKEAYKTDRHIFATPSGTHVSMVRNTLAGNQTVLLNNIILKGIGIIFKDLLGNYEK